MPAFSGSATARLHRSVGTWVLAGPTTAGFSVGNLGVKRVNGAIPVTSVRVDVAEDGTVRAASAVLDIDAINTGIAKRDLDLRKRGLLDLDNHPRLTFSSTGVTPREEAWTVTGLLTAKGITGEITLSATAEDRADGTVGIRLTGQLDRRHYGIKAPRLLIGEIVDVDVECTLRRQ